MAKYNEFEIIKNELENKIETRKIKPNQKGEYKVGYIFANVEKRIYARGKDAADLTHKLIALRDSAIENSKKQKIVETRFDTIAVNWFEVQIKGRGLGKKNVSNYKTILNNHIIEEFGMKDLSEISNSSLQEFLNNKGKTSSISQVKKIKNCLEGIFSFAVSNNKILYNPTANLKMPSCQSFDDSHKKPVTNDEMKFALKTVRSDCQMQIILEMLFIYGMRTIEIVNLKWKNINFDEKFIHIERSKYTDAITTEDNKSVLRYLPLSDIISKHLMQLKCERNINDENEYIFITRQSGNKLDTTTLDKYFKTLTRDMEIVNGAEVFNNKIVSKTGIRHFTPYAFRHGVATKLNAMNYNDALAQCFLGHKPKTVKDIHYSNMTYERELRPAYQTYMDKAEKELQAIINNIN